MKTDDDYLDDLRYMDHYEELMLQVKALMSLCPKGTSLDDIHNAMIKILKDNDNRKMASDRDQKP